jgi:hypothetical protein
MQLKKNTGNNTAQGEAGNAIAPSTEPEVDTWEHLHQPATVVEQLATARQSPSESMPGAAHRTERARQSSSEFVLGGAHRTNSTKQQPAVPGSAPTTGPEPAVAAPAQPGAASTSGSGTNNIFVPLGSSAQVQPLEPTSAEERAGTAGSSATQASDQQQ